jgi:GTP-binding protein
MISAVAGMGLDGLLQDVWKQLDQLSLTDKKELEV